MLAAVLAAACGTAPKKADAPPSGKYYSDDGPPDSVPDNLAELPNAVPRDEPFHRFANRPYTVFGRTYVPVVNKERTRERGIASWYGKKFHGQKTASGEVYDMYGMSAAHPVLPIPSYVRVTNVASGKSVIVRVNDRGPYHANRVIDVSVRTAKLLGFYDNGVTRVRVDYVGRAALEGSDDIKLAATLRSGTPAPGPSEVRIASARPFLPHSAAPVRGAVPVPADRPFDLGHNDTAAHAARRGSVSEVAAVTREPIAPVPPVTKMRTARR